MKPKFDLTALECLLSECIYPKDLADLLDEYLFDYIQMLLQLQKLDEDFQPLSATASFVHHIRELSDALRACQDLEQSKKQLLFYSKN